MRYYPIFLDLRAQRCLVIGGGEVAERKVATLLQADGQVTVISPTLTLQLQSWVEERQITAHLRTYQKGDMHGFSLVFAATDDEELHRQTAAEAQEAGIFLNVVDRPALCSFIVPALVSRGDLTLAISTSGASPAMAKKIRQELTQQFGPEYAQALSLLTRVRELIANARLTLDERQQIFTALVESPLLDYFRAGKIDQVDALLQQAVGAQYTCETLGLTFSL
jgi:precorrin-2 dehydrogenase / sirohydrochlorin ferrochelatase